MAVYELPLNEVVFDFYDRLKSISRGYASFDYQLKGYETGDLVKMSILVNADRSMRSRSSCTAAAPRAAAAHVRETQGPDPAALVPDPDPGRHRRRIIARETIRALRKDVIAKCYGGTSPRKRKLLDKQKEGKKKMRQFGKVDIPRTFIAPP